MQLTFSKLSILHHLVGPLLAPFPCLGHHFVSLGLFSVYKILACDDLFKMLSMHLVYINFDPFFFFYFLAEARSLLHCLLIH